MSLLLSVTDQSKNRGSCVKNAQATMYRAFKEQKS